MQTPEFFSGFLAEQMKAFMQKMMKDMVQHFMSIMIGTMGTGLDLGNITDEEGGGRDKNNHNGKKQKAAKEKGAVEERGNPMQGQAKTSGKQAAGEQMRKDDTGGGIGRAEGSDGKRQPLVQTKITSWATIVKGKGVGP